MIAKAVLVRPNVAALCLVNNARVLSCLRGVTTAMMTRNRHLSKGHLLFLRKGLSSFSYPSMNCHRSFCVRASADSGSSAPIDSPLMESMQKKIKEDLNAEVVVVKDAYGDGRHVSIDVVSSAFEGQSAVNRQRMVYKAIWEELQHTVHAVDQMTTRTPSEASGK